MTTKAKSDSVRKKLSNLAQKLNVPYRNVETVFLIERLVARLVVDKKLSQHLVFKGGFVGLRVYGSPRYTIDLDALLIKANIDSTLELVKQRAETDSDDGTWFRFESQTNLNTQGEYGGVRQVYRVGIGEILPDIRRAQSIHFDLGIGDPITPGHKKQKLLLSSRRMETSVGRFILLKPSVPKNFMHYLCMAMRTPAPKMFTICRCFYRRPMPKHWGPH